MDYYRSLGKHTGEKPINISLIHFVNRVQFLFNKQVSLENATAIKKFLTAAKDREDTRLREIIIDSCHMTDEVLE